MKNLLHGGNAHWSAPTITHYSSFEIGDVTVFTVPLDLDKKWPDFHKHLPLYNVAAMTQIERQSITEALTCIGYGYRNGKNIAHAAHCLPSTIHSLLMHT